MPDVSSYVAAITAGAVVLGAGVSLTPVYMRDVRLADQHRREPHAETRRQAVLEAARYSAAQAVPGIVISR